MLGGRTARWARAPDGTLTGVVSESGQWARFGHDTEGRISAATDQVGDRVSVPLRSTRTVCSPTCSRESSTNVPAFAAVAVGYRYQPVTGRLVAVTDGRRDRIRFSYDGAGRVTRRTGVGTDIRGSGVTPTRSGSRRVRIPWSRGIDHVAGASIGRRSRDRAFVVRSPSGRAPPAQRSSPAPSSPTPGYLERADGTGVFVDARGRVAASRYRRCGHSSRVRRPRSADHDRFSRRNLYRVRLHTGG